MKAAVAKMKIAAFILLLTSCGLPTTATTRGRWPKSLLRRSPVERCIEAHVYPCRLPRGRFPWTPSVFHNFTSYVQFNDGFEEAKSYRPVESLSKQVKVWVSDHVTYLCLEAVEGFLRHVYLVICMNYFNDTKAKQKL